MDCPSSGDWLNGLEDALQVVGGDRQGVAIARGWLELSTEPPPIKNIEAVLRQVQTELLGFLSRLERPAAPRAPTVTFAGECRFVWIPETGSSGSCTCPLEIRQPSASAACFNSVLATCSPAWTFGVCADARSASASSWRSDTSASTRPNAPPGIGSGASIGRGGTSSSLPGFVPLVDHDVDKE